MLKYLRLYSQSFFGVIILLGFYGSGHAQDSTKTSKKAHFKNQYYFSAGAFRPLVSTTLQVNGKTGPGAIVSLEENLGFTERPWMFRVEGMANFTKRSGVYVIYTNLNRKNEWTADRDISIFDTTFHVGAKLKIIFNTAFIAASYKYTVFSRPEWEGGLSVGIRYLQIKTGVDFQSQNFSEYSETVDIPAPVPVFGLYGAANMTKHWRVRYNFDYFTISVKGTKGGVFDNRFGLEYYIIKNLGIGAAANFLNFQVKEIPLAEDFDGKVNYSMNGLSIFVAARF